MSKFITNQRELAEAINRTPEQLSRLKNRKSGFSDEVVSGLHKITGISVAVWVSGPKRKLNRELREFFERERARKTYNL